MANHSRCLFDRDKRSFERSPVSEEWFSDSSENPSMVKGFAFVNPTEGWKNGNWRGMDGWMDECLGWRREIKLKSIAEGNGKGTCTREGG